MVGLFGGWLRKEEGQGDHPQKDLILHGSHQFMPSELQQLLAQPASNSLEPTNTFSRLWQICFTFKVWATQG